MEHAIQRKKMLSQRALIGHMHAMDIIVDLQMQSLIIATAAC